MVKILAIDTTEDSCSAAVLVNGAVLNRFQLALRRHSELILPMMDELMAEAQLTPTQLDALAFSRGPGSFTGVRIATGVAQGVALGADIPLVPVSTLAALAQGAWREQGVEKVFSALDARMGEVYWGLYDIQNGFAQPVGEETLSRPENIRVEVEGTAWVGVGSGWKSYPGQLQRRMAVSSTQPQRYIHALDVAILGAASLRNGQAVDAARALPVYLRDKVAQKASAR